MKRRTFFHAAGAAILGSVGSGAALAQELRPIRLLVGATAGGVPDINAREIARRLSSVLGQTIVVENKPGGSGTIAANEVRRAAPDGLTIGSTYMSIFSVAPLVMASKPFNPVTDFSHIGIWTHGYFVMATHAKSGINSVAELLTAARRDPGKVSFGSEGVLGPTHLFMTQFQSEANVKLNHVPFKGSADVMLAGVRGEVPVIVNGPPLLLPHFASGKLKPLAVLAPKRLSVLPNVPTMTEAGVSGVGAPVWHGLIAPPNLPAPIMDRFASALKTVCADPGLIEWNAKFGRATEPKVGLAMRDHVAQEVAIWEREAKRSGLRADG